MMVDKLWKKSERAWAKRLTEATGVEYRRNPVPGRATGEVGDVTAKIGRDGLLNTECKKSKDFAPKWIKKALDQAAAAVEKSPHDEIRVVYLEWKDIKVAMLPEKDFLRLCGRVNWSIVED